jgi:putative ABC transport system ATP-binding protein
MAEAETPLKLSTEDICKSYRPGSAHAVQAVTDITLEIAEGAVTLIRGPSGSGKTTLLCLLGTLLRPTSGRLLLDGRDVSRFGDAELTRIRRSRIGFVFQAFHLLPKLPAWKNVSYPLIPVVPSEAERKRRAYGLLRALGLEDRGSHTPEELSGGEQQRVAFARALVAEPAVLLADEPTSNIDEESIRNLIGILERLKNSGMTVVVASHDARLQTSADRVVTLRGGRLSTP